MNDDKSDIPEFLRRTETPEQADKRRAKNKPRDTSGGLKVIQPHQPAPEAIRKAIARDLRDDECAGGDALPGCAAARPQSDADVLKQFVARGRAAQSAVDRINEERAKDGLRPYNPKRKKEKPLPPVIAKAVAQKEMLEKIAQTAQSQPMENKTMKKTKKATVKTKTAKTSKTKTAKTVKPVAAKKSARVNGSYDWDAAKKTAESGKLPPLPSFKSYGSHIAAFYDLAKKKDLAGIAKLRKEYVNETGARTNMFRFVDLCVAAVKHA